jgi:hypothetical protein
MTSAERRISKSMKPILACLRGDGGEDRLVPGGHEEHEAVLALDEDLVQLAAAEAAGGLLAEAEQRGGHGAEPVLVHVRRAAPTPWRDRRRRRRRQPRRPARS